jgi:hypothetical protein
VREFAKFLTADWINVHDERLTCCIETRHATNVGYRKPRARVRCYVLSNPVAGQRMGDRLRASLKGDLAIAVRCATEPTLLVSRSVRHGDVRKFKVLSQELFADSFSVVPTVCHVSQFFCLALPRDYAGETVPRIYAEAYICILYAGSYITCLYDEPYIGKIYALAYILAGG